MSLTLPPLPYAFDALEPHVSLQTLSLHHGRHHAAYLDKTLQLVRGTSLESATLEQVVRASVVKPDRRLFHAAAQAWNHGFYWLSMRPQGGGKPNGEAARRVAESFGNHQAFCQEFIKAASDQFGSGWAWLVLDDERLRIRTTSNADTALVWSATPLLVCDVWEHAYYLDYQNRRIDYITAFLANLANWDFVNANLERHALAGRAKERRPQS